MERMTGQTKIIVATACCLALVDIAVRTMTAPMPGTPCAGCVGMDSHGVLTARAVRLVDNHGNVRGLWNTDEHGEPALWMYDRNGVKRVELDSTDNTPSLSLHDMNGNRRVYFGMDNRDGKGLFRTIEDSKVVTFSFDGSDDRSHFEMNGGGVFTGSETLETGVAYDARPMPHTIFAPGVHPVVEDADSGGTK